MSQKLRIGMICYPTHGGSGVVAVELAHELAEKGHEIHVISYDTPLRLDLLRKNIFFHLVKVPAYPLFEYPPYSLALAAQTAEVVCRHNLDILHAHYAIPHAMSAWLARQISERIENLPIITTLHGTDITLVGNDPSYLSTTKYSLNNCDNVTMVSHWLLEKVEEVLGCACNHHVIYNFVDSNRFKPKKTNLRARLNSDSKIPILMHMSNFRPVKRVKDVAEIFLMMREKIPLKLVMVGDGPDRADVEVFLKQSPFADDVLFLGKQSKSEDILPAADLFVMTSNAESFGLAALEAQSCGVPVIGYNAGGLSEVIANEETGLLVNVGEMQTLADDAVELLNDKKRYKRMSSSARERASNKFSTKILIEEYERVYYTSIEILKDKYPESFLNRQDSHCKDS